jgi:hypothetical protein
MLVGVDVAIFVEALWALWLYLGPMDGARAHAGRFVFEDPMVQPDPAIAGQ